MKENIKTKSGIFKGVNLKTLSAISFLINSYSVRKSILLLVMIIITLPFFLASIQWVWRSDVSSHIIKMFFMGIVFMPVFFLTMFSIPSTISQMHSTTLIKRIGSTRLNEKGYMLSVWIVFFIRALIYFAISLLFWTAIYSLIVKYQIMMAQVTDDRISTITSKMILSLFLENSFSFITFSIIYIMFLVSLGILLGMIPIGQISKGILSLILFISIIIFGNILTPLSLTLNELIPVLSIFITILNPITLLSTILEGLYNGSFSMMYSVLYYILALTLVISTFLLAASFMSFKSIK